MKDATKSKSSNEELMKEDKNKILGKNCLETKLNLTYLLIIYIPFFYLHLQDDFKYLKENKNYYTKILIETYLLNYK